MKPFKFRLGRVLRIRQVEEDLASTRFKECVAVMQRADEVAQSLSEELRRARDELFETRAHKRIPPEELLLAHTTLQSLEETLAEQRRRSAELQLEADNLRASWEGSRRDRQALEQLAERRKRDHFDEQEKLAGQELDETALRRASANQEQASSSLTASDADDPNSPERTLP